MNFIQSSRNGKQCANKFALTPDGRGIGPAKRENRDTGPPRWPEEFQGLPAAIPASGQRTITSAEETSELELLAEVNLAYQLVFQHFIRRAFGDHLAFGKDVGAFADAQGFTDIVVGDQHADAAVVQMLDDALDVAHCNRVNASEGLVKQDEAR